MGEDSRPGAHPGDTGSPLILQRPDQALSAAFPADGCHMHARLLAALRLETADGGMLELSGLAWSRDEQQLYAVGDEGVLLWLRPRFAGDGRLAAIEGQKLLPLQNEQGQALQGSDSDSEGLALRHGADGRSGNDELLVSFERRPRICRYSPHGEFRGCETLPPSLADARRYRGRNRGLEAIALHPRFGILTGPERALHGSPKRQLSVYSLGGKDWNVPAQHDQARLAGMSVLPGGGLLLLERNRRGLLGLRLQVAVHLAPDLGKRPVQSRLLLLLDSRKFPIDNLEGIAVQDERRFFLVSDDNGPLLPPGNTQLLHVEWSVPPPADCPTP